jgi:hypothetical protein
MNWDYVRVKNKQKENKNKQTKRKQTKKKKLKIVLSTFDSRIHKTVVIINIMTSHKIQRLLKIHIYYMLFSYQTGYIM